MPSEKILKQKQQIVEELADKMGRASAGVFVDYRGITVEEDTKLRAEMRKVGVDYAVVKNTMTRFAAQKIGLDGLDETLNGTTALAMSFEDPVAPAKVIQQYAAKHDKFQIKSGFVEGRVISAAEVVQLASMPPKEILIARAMGSILSPASGLANVVNATMRSLAIALNAIAEQKGA